MCNEAYRRTQLGQVAQDWGETRIPLVFPEGVPNFPPLDGFRITDRVEIIRAVAGAPADAPAAEMVTRRWSWPGPGGRPVYNFRSDGRRIGDGRAGGASGGRCLIPVDGFFEFTDPPPPPEDAPRPAKRARKSKWAFTLVGRPWFCIAGVWRADPDVGEAFAMLTCPPGPDVAPYHSRQVVVILPEDFARWLSGAAASAELCRPLPAGSLAATQVR